MTIAVDFDGTIVENRYPEIGDERMFATETLKMLIQDRHRLILWTCREGRLLDDAINWCKERGVEFWAINKDFPEENITKNQQFSRKIKADLFIDDRMVGGLPDWGTIYQMIKKIRHLSKSFKSHLVKSMKKKSQRKNIGGSLDKANLHL